MRQILEVMRDFNQELNAECVKDIIQIVKDNGGEVVLDDPTDNIIHTENCGGEDWEICVESIVCDETEELTFWGYYLEDEDDDGGGWSLNNIMDMRDVYAIHDNLVNGEFEKNN